MFYKGAVIYNKAPANSRGSSYCGYVNTSPRPSRLDDNRNGVCVYSSSVKDNIKPFNLQQVATAMKAIVTTINNCENDRIRSSRRGTFFGYADAPVVV